MDSRYPGFWLSRVTICSKYARLCVFICQVEQTVLIVSTDYFALYLSTTLLIFCCHKWYCNKRLSFTGWVGVCWRHHSVCGQPTCWRTGWNSTATSRFVYNFSRNLKSLIYTPQASSATDSGHGCVAICGCLASP